MFCIYYLWIRDIVVQTAEKNDMWVHQFVLPSCDHNLAGLIRSSCAVALAGSFDPYQYEMNIGVDGIACQTYSTDLVQAASVTLVCVLATNVITVFLTRALTVELSGTHSPY